MNAVIWNKGAPPKRGAYRVKSDGPSANTGFRYWHGERWSGLSATRAWCIKANKDGPGRNSRLKYPVLWASPAPAAVPTEHTQLVAVRAAINKYYDALTARQHGGVAAGQALNEIETALDMSWHARKEGTQ